MKKQKKKGFTLWNSQVTAEIGFKSNFNITVCILSAVLKNLVSSIYLERPVS